MYEHKSGVSFRKAESTDLNFLHEMKRETWWGTHSVAIINDMDQEKWFDNLPSDCLVLIGEVPVHDQMLSYKYLGYFIISDIDWIARTASISGAVKDSERSHGKSLMAFEAGLDFAFEMLNFHRLNAEVAAFNYPARKIEVVNLGFTVEGTKRQSIYKCGRYYDSFMLGMLRTEWESHPRVVSMGGSCCKNFCHDMANKMVKRANR